MDGWPKSRNHWLNWYLKPITVQNTDTASQINIKNENDGPTRSVSCNTYSVEATVCSATADEYALIFFGVTSCKCKPCLRPMQCHGTFNCFQFSNIHLQLNGIALHRKVLHCILSHYWTMPGCLLSKEEKNLLLFSQVSVLVLNGQTGANVGLPAEQEWRPEPEHAILLAMCSSALRSLRRRQHVTQYAHPNNNNLLSCYQAVCVVVVEYPGNSAFHCI